MENNQDPRIQIPADLHKVQEEIDDAAKERIRAIKKEAKEDAKSIKNEMKGLKKEAKEGLKNYKENLENSNDPTAKEKISVAESVHKVVEKNIENDYQRSKDQLTREKDYRISSIENMLDDEKSDR